jgi:hypothetical protein
MKKAVILFDLYSMGTGDLNPVLKCCEPYFISWGIDITVRHSQPDCA